MKNTQSPPTRKCSCACDPACNCNCSCARHCDCKKPCEKRCGSELSRNLIVSLDGTLNEFGLYNTNVVELHSRIDPDNSNQRKYYNSGLGTYVPHRTLSLWKRFRQLFTSLREFTIAWNFHVKILKAYKWLCETYKPGDKIFLFGFSRGAYQVRALAAMIHKVGLIHHAEDDMIQFAYDVYEERNTPSLPKRIFRKIMTVVTGRATNERVYTAKDCKGAFSREVETHFIGVWDTVSSIGLFGQKPLPDTWKAEHICIFRHALALDERRVKFLPEYVAGDHSIPPLGSEGASNLLSRGATLAAPESSSEANVGEGTIVDAKEVWFAGCHSDIGGGSRINLELDLASIPLLWMEKEAASAGLRMKQRKTGDVWNMRDLGKDTVTDALNGLLGPFYHFVEILPISRLSYDSEVSGKRTCVPHCRAGRIIVSGQLIHASVAFQQKPYIPRATFSKPPLEWPSLVGHDLGNDDFRWVPRFADVLEMDLFDGPSIYHAISEFQAASPPTDVDYWILRLKFMALSGRLAVTYLGQLADGEDRLEKARDARMLLEGIKDSNGESDPAFHAEVVTLLEYEARELLGRKNHPEEALKLFNRAVAIRRDILVRAKALPSQERGDLAKEKDHLATCLESASACSLSLGRGSDAARESKEAVDLRQQLASADSAPFSLRKAKLLWSLILQYEVSRSSNGEFEQTMAIRQAVIKLSESIVVGSPEVSPQTLLASALFDLGDILRTAILPAQAAFMESYGRKLDRSAGAEWTEAMDEFLIEFGRTQQIPGADLFDARDMTDLLQRVRDVHPLLGAFAEGLIRSVDGVEPATNTEAQVSQRTPIADRLADNKIERLLDSAATMRAKDRSYDALRANEEIVALRRNSEGPTAIYDLAISLHSFAGDLRAMDSPAEALRVDEEAIQLLRNLLSDEEAIESLRNLADPATETLAHWLHSMGIFLRALDRPLDALRVDEEAIALWRTRSAMTENLAQSLDSLADDLRALDCPGDAIEQRKKAADIWQGMATRPRDLANSLHNIAVDLRVAGRHVGAVPMDEEALKLRGPLAKADPALKQDLADSWHALAIDFRALKQYAFAVLADEEAVRLRSQLAKADPVFIKDLADSWHALGSEFRDSHQHADAVLAAEEAVRLRRQLVEADPAFKKDLADSLHCLAVDFHNLDQHADAVPAFEEAVRLRRQLADADRTCRTNLSLADSLAMLAHSHRQLGYFLVALMADAEALELQRTDPDASQLVADSLQGLSWDLYALRRPDTAHKRCVQAVKIYREIPTPGPAVELKLAGALRSLAAFRRSRRDVSSDASAFDEKADGIYGRLTVTSPRQCAQSVFVYGLIFRAIGLTDDAAHACGTAVELFRILPGAERSLANAVRRMSPADSKATETDL